MSYDISKPNLKIITYGSRLSNLDRDDNVIRIVKNSPTFPDHYQQKTGFHFIYIKGKEWKIRIKNVCRKTIITKRRGN